MSAKSRLVNPSWVGGMNKLKTAKIVESQRLLHAATLYLLLPSFSRLSMTHLAANTAANNECDSNADTCCLGKNFVVLQATYRTADVYAYDSSIKPLENVPIVTGATAYDDLVSGNTFILVFNESLYYGNSLDHSLINPNQLRAYGVPLWDNPYDPARPLSLDVDNDLSIPLQTSGTKIYFRTRVPTATELAECDHLTITSPSPWDPSQVVMLQEMHQGGTAPWKRPLPSVSTSFPPKYEYVEANSDDALLHSVDPSLV
jgi:hypothetical protein